MTLLKKIFDGQTTNGYSDVFNGNRDAWIKIKGIWDGATISLYAKTPHDDDDFSSTGYDEKFSDDVAFSPKGKQTVAYKLRLENAGASTNIDAFVLE